jgi:hypothetical protein
VRRTVFPPHISPLTAHCFVDPHFHTLCRTPPYPLFHATSVSTFSPLGNSVNRIKSGTCAIFQAPYFGGVASWWPPSEETVRRRRFGLLGRGDDRGARSLRASLNLVITRSEQVEPVACATRSDVAPRSAVRRVGPRPDPTRSACMDEPGGTAIRPGNQHWGLSSPSRTAISQTVARREKNGGASSDSSRSMCGTAVTAKAVRPFLFSPSEEQEARSEAVASSPSSLFANPSPQCKSCPGFSRKLERSRPLRPNSQVSA